MKKVLYTLLCAILMIFLGACNESASTKETTTEASTQSTTSTSSADTTATADEVFVTYATENKVAESAENANTNVNWTFDENGQVEVPEYDPFDN